MPKVVVQSAINKDIYKFEDLAKYSFSGRSDYMKASLVHNFITNYSEEKLAKSQEDFNLNYGFAISASEMRNVVAVANDYMLLHFWQ